MSGLPLPRVEQIPGFTPDDLSLLPALGFVPAPVMGGDGWVASCVSCSGRGPIPRDRVYIANGTLKRGICRCVKSCRNHFRQFHSTKRDCSDHASSGASTGQPGAFESLVYPSAGEVSLPVQPGENAVRSASQPSVDLSGLPTDPAPASEDDPPRASDPVSPSDVSSAPFTEGREQFEAASAVPSWSSATGSPVSVAGESMNEGSLVGATLARGPRKGSGRWFFHHRLDSIAQGSDLTALQLAYNISELREQGVSKNATNLVCHVVRNVLHSFKNSDAPLRDVTVAGSTHLVEKVLGVREPGEFEFGWCPKCGLRHPPRSTDISDVVGGLAQRLLQLTCPNCGSPKYKVLTPVAL